MPYKENLKNPSRQAKAKTGYRVTNWSEYNASLKKRGQLTLYLPKGDLRSHFINESPYQEGLSGQQPTYSRAYIEILYIFYRVLGWGMRQTLGYVEELWRTQGLDIPVPSFGHLSDMFSTVTLEIRQECSRLSKRLKEGESISLILDSTGMNFGKAGSWYETKYNKACSRTPWKKYHLSIDPDLNIHGAEVTEETVGDREKVKDLMPEGLCIDKIIADTGYYSKHWSETLYQKGITPVIPPPANASAQRSRQFVWHNKVVRYIQEKGSVYAFYKKYGYGIRSLVEAQFSRIKRCLGSAFKTQRESSQKQEAIVIANIINKWNAFGRCLSVKIP